MYVDNVVVAKQVHQTNRYSQRFQLLTKWSSMRDYADYKEISIGVLQLELLMKQEMSASKTVQLKKKLIQKYHQHLKLREKAS